MAQKDTEIIVKSDAEDKAQESLSGEIDELEKAIAGYTMSDKIKRMLKNEIRQM